MNENSLKVVSESLNRCIKNAEFLDRFYEEFIASSDEVRDKFKNTNMKRQKRVLLISLANILIADERPSVLSEIAIKHNAQHFDIEPHLYLLWLDCLIEAVKDCDPFFNNKIEKSWRRIMQKGIDYMISQYK